MAVKAQNIKVSHVVRAISVYLPLTYPIYMPHWKWTHWKKSWVSIEREPTWPLLFLQKRNPWDLTFIYVLYISHNHGSPLRKVNSSTSEVISYYIPSSELVDDKWILSVSLLENINAGDTNAQNIFQGMLRVFWPGDNLWRWYSGLPHITKESPGISFSYNLEEPN